MPKAQSSSSPETNHSSFTWPIQRIHREPADRVHLDDPIVVEEPLEIVLNGRSVAVLMRMPGQEKDLAAGFCVSEGYIRNARDILILHHCGSGLPAPGEEETGDGTGSRNRVELMVTDEGLLSPEGADVLRVIRSGCGAADVSAMSETLPRLPLGFTVDPYVILALGRSMRDLQDLHQVVGGTHSAALFEATGQPVTQAEDRGLTLIGYLRGGRMNVYTHAERLKKG